MSRLPMITIDGPSASGKGTVAQHVAEALGWHWLDSGAIYRVLAYLSLRDHVEEGMLEPLLESARRMESRDVLRFDRAGVWVDGREVSADLRQEQCGDRASRLAAVPAVREALLQLQRSFAQSPGLVSDGRDMGTVVFPTATLKVFLTASAEVRAKRRFLQLSQAGVPANFDSLLLALRERDERDMQRAVAPLKPAEDAEVLDTSELTAAQAVEQILVWYRARTGS